MEIDLSAGLFVLKPSKDGPRPSIAANPDNADILPPEVAFTTLMDDETPEPRPETEGIWLLGATPPPPMNAAIQTTALAEMPDEITKEPPLISETSTTLSEQMPPQSPLPAATLPTALPATPKAKTSTPEIKLTPPHAAESAALSTAGPESKMVSPSEALPPLPKTPATDKPQSQVKTPTLAAPAAPASLKFPDTAPPRAVASKLTPAITAPKAPLTARPELPGPKAKAPAAAPVLPASPPLFQFSDIETPDLAPELKIESQAVSLSLKAQPIHRAAPPVAAQISVQLQNQIGKSDNQTIELRLDPPELGRVTVHITTHDQTVAAQITAERVDTVDLMRRHADLLAATLEKAGFAQANLSFQQGSSGQQQEKGPEFGVLALPSDPTPSAPIAVKQTPSDGRLDIRL